MRSLQLPVFMILLSLASLLAVVGCSKEPAADPSTEEGEKPAQSRAKEDAATLLNLDDGALPDELVILGGGRDVAALVKELGGEITFSVEETNTHQAKFPVKNAAELHKIAEKLRAKGVQVSRAHVFRPPVPEGRH